MDIIKKIHNSEIKILEFNLMAEKGKDHGDIFLKILVNNEELYICFNNVSNLNINNFSMPFQIYGFEILCNDDKGWEKSKKYTINDFEEGAIKFYCESIAWGDKHTV